MVSPILKVSKAGLRVMGSSNSGKPANLHSFLIQEEQHSRNAIIMEKGNRIFMEVMFEDYSVT
jgi:hypothetical protein